MKAQSLSNTLTCEGILDEHTESTEIQKALQSIKRNGNAPIDVDFSKVKYANSTGIVTWLKIAKSTALPFRYVNAPVWLVGQFNMIRDFFENGSHVESFCAPYYCTSTQESRALTLHMGKEVPVKSNYTEIKFPNVAVDGKTYEIDFVPERYFNFIAENFKVFKEKYP
jgi:hypothetical protein